MRGLTPAERSELLEACVPPCRYQQNVPNATEAEELVYAKLKSDGRVYEAPWENETHYGVVYLATDLGRLALRVCPVGEP